MILCSEYNANNGSKLGLAGILSRKYDTKVLTMQLSLQNMSMQADNNKSETGTGNDELRVSMKMPMKLIA